MGNDGQRLTEEPFAIRGGKLSMPKTPGLGVKLDMAQVEKAHALYKSLDVRSRNDAMAMQYLIDGWSFDPKRSALVR